MTALDLAFGDIAALSYPRLRCSDTPKHDGQKPESPVDVLRARECVAQRERATAAHAAAGAMTSANPHAPALADMLLTVLRGEVPRLDPDSVAAQSCASFARVRDRCVAINALVVELSDGTALPYADALQLLAKKEADGPHALRRFVARAEVLPLRALADAVVAWASRPLPTPNACQRAEVLLRETDAARDTALTILLGVSVVSRDEAACTRALDLPDPRGTFALLATQALLRASPVMASLRGVRAPAPLAGWVLHDDVRPVALFTDARPQRMALHVTQLWGASLATLPAAAAALPLSFASAVVRRQVLQLSKADAAHEERVLVSWQLLQARAAAALLIGHQTLVTVTEPEERMETLRSAVKRAIGTDVDEATRERLWLSYWRTGDALLGAAAIAEHLRDALDEDFVLSKDLSDVVPQLPAVAPEAHATAWVEWLNRCA